MGVMPRPVASPFKLAGGSTIDGLGGEILGKMMELSSSSELDFRRCKEVPLTAIVLVFNIPFRHEGV